MEAEESDPGIVNDNVGGEWEETRAEAFVWRVWQLVVRVAIRCSTVPPTKRNETQTKMFERVNSSPQP